MASMPVPGVNLGGGTIVNPGTGPSNSGTGINTSSIKSDASTSTSATGQFNVNGMSAKEMARYKRRCVDILANRSSYDNDLVALCQAIREQSVDQAARLLAACMRRQQRRAAWRSLAEPSPSHCRFHASYWGVLHLAVLI